MPELFIIVDDYDMVATSASNPLLPLVDQLAQAKDLGFHLILARRTGGAGRAIYDPVISRLRDLGVDGLVMSGSREEGALIADVRPSPLPPGRGVFVTRSRAPELVQICDVPLQHDD